MYKLNTLLLKDLVIEHQHSPVGIDVKHPRFGWKLESQEKNTVQASYQIRLYSDSKLIADTGIVETSQSIEVIIPSWETEPKTCYEVQVTVSDNWGRTALIESFFETGLLETSFQSSWVEPEQEPTPSSMTADRETGEIIAADPYVDGKRDFHEFRPAQYIRIPCILKKGIKKARIYATAHGLYRLEVNGLRSDDREFAPENTSYDKILQYQTYDVTSLLSEGTNVIGVVLADGWWVGRVGTTGDCCQYGNTVGLLLDAVIEYNDGTTQFVSGEQGVSSPGPIIFSDLFVGEKYDAAREMPGWSTASFHDETWTPVLKKEYGKENLTGQYAPPVRPIEVLQPLKIFTAPNGDVILDAGQVVAGQVEISLTAEAGHTITLEHSEVMGNDGNYFNNILNVNKEQTDIYITKDGFQTFRPAFSYHGFRYVRIQGWPGHMSLNHFKIYVFTSEMDELSSFHTSDERINQLESNIWWSQIANTISIPTDCPQREKAGWTGDIMAYSPTLCFRRDADAFLTSWMASVRADQLESGAVPMIVPYLKAYRTFLKENLGTDTSCGWGDAVIVVPYEVYKAYGDRRILEDNYEAMRKWLQYIAGRARNHHPEDYDFWDEKRKENSRYLWNTDFHFGDWLIPSIVLGNPDANAMNDTAYATMGVVAPAYYAFSALTVSEIAGILDKADDEAYYKDLYEKIRKAFIEEYVHEDGTMDVDFQGIYVIALKMNLVPDGIKPKMVQYLCDLIEENGNRLDTGFLSVLFLMDVLCDNGRSDVAYKLLFQTACPSWLYEVESGGTTMWESWGAVGEDGSVSTYSYNHYAFGCIGDWMYRHLGGLQILEPGYKKFRIAPSFDSGLTSADIRKETPYGTITAAWRIIGDTFVLHTEIPANTQAVVDLPGRSGETFGSGSYDFVVNIQSFIK